MPTVTQLLIEIFFSPALSSVCVNPAECNWGCLLWQTVKIQEKHGRKYSAPNLQGTAVYPPVYIVSPPILLPPNSSIPLHNQARYLHSFSMLNCALKKPIFFTLSKRTLNENLRYRCLCRRNLKQDDMYPVQAVQQVFGTWWCYHLIDSGGKILQRRML